MNILCVPDDLFILFQTPHRSLQERDRVGATRRAPGPEPQTYHVVDTGEGRAVSDGFKGWPGAVAVRGGGHLPAELHQCLVDTRLAATLPHDGVLREMGVAGGHANQRVAGGRGFLDSLLAHFFYMVIVRKRDNLKRSNKASDWAGRWEAPRTKGPLSREPRGPLTARDSLKYNKKKKREREGGRKRENITVEVFIAFGQASLEDTTDL